MLNNNIDGLCSCSYIDEEVIKKKLGKMNRTYLNRPSDDWFSFHQSSSRCVPPSILPFNCEFIHAAHSNLNVYDKIYFYSQRMTSDDTQCNQNAGKSVAQLSFELEVEKWCSLKKKKKNVLTKSPVSWWMSIISASLPKAALTYHNGIY